MPPADQFPVPRSRRREIADFSVLVGDWAFNVDWAFREALDIRHAQWIDIPATEQARSAALRAGASAEEAKKVKRFRSVWAQGTPPLYAFSEGDTLHHRTRDIMVQVTKTTGAALRVTLFFGRRACGELTITQAQFVDILRFHTALEEALLSIE